MTLKGCHTIDPYIYKFVFHCVENNTFVLFYKHLSHFTIKKYSYVIGNF